MKLRLFVSLKRILNYGQPLYTHPTRYRKETEERVSALVQSYDINDIAEHIIRLSINFMREHDAFLLLGIQESDVRAAKVSIEPSTHGPHPEIPLIADDELYALLLTDSGETVMGTIFPMRSGEAVVDYTVVRKPGKDTR